MNPIPPEHCPLCNMALDQNHHYTKYIRVCPQDHYDYYILRTKKIISETYGGAGLYISVSHDLDGKFRYAAVVNNSRTIKYYDENPSIDEIKKFLKLSVLS